MYDLIASVLNVLKVSSITIDNNLFRLHYKLTMFILVVFSLLVTQRQYFGDPIDCLIDSEVDFIDTFCWIQTTFSIKNPFDNGIYHVGLGNPNEAFPDPTFSPDKRYHMYYQWVTLFLYLQALMFYIPWYIWKNWEGGKLKMLLDGMNMPISDEKEIEKKKKFLVSFFKLNINNQNIYAYKFFFCEILNFINVVLQIFITDMFVGYEFTTYGTKVFSETQNAFASRHDALERVFPKVTKCTFTRQGPSGTVEKLDALCVLPLNVFNEKIYIFLWFWFVLVAIISGMGILFRLASFYPPFRRLLLIGKAKLVKVSDINIISEKSDIGDWFLLYQSAKNMNEITFKSFMTDLALEL